ncbi:outer membrane usher protein [Winslowiella iniecta]|uniref:outer membrane usher protein n=1 Tax=Winslowiella iniecta TaxID=1560201 RepID=UPI00069FAAD5|nr:outer membrane usher protein [Winslowiella iniecta]
MGIKKFKIKSPGFLAFSMFLALAPGLRWAWGGDIQFNTDVLDVEDRNNIDITRFAHKGYIMPGRYLMSVRLNKDVLAERPIDFYPAEDNPDITLACLSPKLVNEFGLRPQPAEQLAWWHGGECLDIRSLKGMQARGDLSNSTLTLSLPQAYLEYQSANWDPPSRWDNGVPGILFDYNINSQLRSNREGSDRRSLSGMGTVGANAGAWRLRAEWQGRRDQEGDNKRNSFDWTRYYAYRAIPRLEAKLVVGEDYLVSDIFDSFRYAGASLRTDDNMLPPNLRGYAPEVTGVARTNARVIVMHQGRVLYESQVAAGPFRIQDISDSVMGELNVRVEEEDGSVQTFSLNTANIPYLTRPGRVRYKMSIGRPVDWQHSVDGPEFASGEFSWGINSGWSMYGGAIGSEKYQALALGVGRDLLAFGAMAFDVTRSVAQLPWGETLQGNSYRLSYSKRFDDYGSQVTFAGYRFSERQFMSMGEYLDARSRRSGMSNSKEMYTITFAQDIKPIDASAQFSYNRQTYWDRPESERYSIALSRYFDFMQWRNLSLSLSAWRNRYSNNRDDGVYLSLSVPLGNGGTLSYNGSLGRGNNSNQLNYSDRRDNGDTYSLSSGISRNGPELGGYYQRESSLAQMSGSVNYQQGNFTSLGGTIKGGITATADGMALHRQNTPGGTRLLLDTDGVADIPVRGSGGAVYSNQFGKLVIPDVSSYYRNQVNIDINKLPENADVSSSVVQATLTEGAIGYRKFAVVSGEKAMAVIRLANGSVPPFGAQVLNLRQQEVGLVGDGGSVWLSGIKPGESMSVHWDGEKKCLLSLPEMITPSALANLLLPCSPVGAAEGKSENQSADYWLSAKSHQPAE